MTGVLTVSPLVVGVGRPDRGDDAVGPAVARAVAELGLADVTVLVHEDPTDLVLLWEGRDVAVVVDAVLSGRSPGSVVVTEAGLGQGAMPARTWGQSSGAGSHAFGIADAVELARALGRLPRRVVLVGVEGAAFGPGAPMSEAVAAAVPAALTRVRAVLADAVAGGEP